eukprot:Gregarina_sp_Pseudo_9__977@NODE_1628_length_1443_cov_2224_274217_g1454_i1_p1_GENE_NODE_1628_length_1443_cov_2224_274217_g1454_i1NODE_1628_length_1443_cov_2224_274217_g1454_i1_p1_ORF_typecomplete_len427_score44_36Integrin_beta/PF00362_18/9_8e27VWA/PF00092_28/0_0034PARM/PF17061_5/6_6_NODE_1628_length_1443_cov_2224_274217_g1454_i11011381
MKVSSFVFLSMITHAEEICYLPLDVMFLQDTTGSFEDDLPNVVKQIPTMVSSILADHPDTFFGVAEFKDKPYFPLGEPTDFCYKLGDGRLSADMSDFNWAYSGLYASGGGDLPEAQFQALIDIALDPQVGWRPLAAEGTSARAGQSGARLVIMSTDAVPHLPGDISKYDPAQYPALPQNLPPNSGDISTGDVNYECLFQDYPSDLQMKNALLSQDIFLAILTPNDPAIVPAWKWVNEELLGQPADFYQFISSDSSDLISGVLQAIDAVTSYLCPTTTALPSTPPPDLTTTLPVTTTEAAATPPPTTTKPTTTPAPTEPTTTAASTQPRSTPAPTEPTTSGTPAPTEQATTLTPTQPPSTLAPSEPVTSAASTSSPSISTPATPGVTELPVTCPPCEHPCHDPCQCCPAVVVKIAEKPSYLRIDYQK